MAEQSRKPSSAKQTNPRAPQSKKSSTTSSKKPSKTGSTGNSSSARSSSKKSASQPTSSSRAKAKAPTAKSAPRKSANKPPAISKAQVKEQADKYKSKADKYRNDPKKAEDLLREAEKKARKNPGPISGRMQDLATLLRLVRAYFSKEYTDVPWETVALAIGAVAYFVSPIDLIPDFIPVAGYVDDAAVIGFVIASAANDLHNFREWEAEQQLGT